MAKGPRKISVTERTPTEHWTDDPTYTVSINATVEDKNGKFVQSHHLALSPDEARTLVATLGTYLSEATA